MTQQWTARYVAYANAHGKTPEAMLEADRATWPSAPMTGFLCWRPGVTPRRPANADPKCPNCGGKMGELFDTHPGRYQCYRCTPEEAEAAR